MGNAFIQIALAAFVLLLGCAAPQDGHGETYHAHADFKVYIIGKALDFNKAEYMGTPYKELSERVHLHDFNPNIMHFHAKDATVGEFFKSLGMELSKEKFSNGKIGYFSGEKNKLFFYVNGKENSKYGDYIPKDLDKILIYSGSAELAPQMLDSVAKTLNDSVTSEACIYSEKCAVPEGFTLPEESCSGLEPCKLE